ncbi:hypothetical protein M3Y96_00245700 [Aphelenchoides besseyi]|nr:hypothetical protein M3Y96_00245700 [Aphelenchoides besseyi]
MEVVWFSLLVLSLGFIHQTQSNDDLIVALTSECHFYVFSDVGLQDTKILFSQVNKTDGPCQYATVTWHDGFMLIARYVEPKTVEMAASRIEVSDNGYFIDLSNQFRKMNHSHVLNDCIYERELLSIFIDFHVLYMVASCSSELGALTRSIVYTDGKVNTPSGQLIYFNKTINETKGTFFAGASIDEYDTNATDPNDSLFIRVDTNNNNTVWITELHQLNASAKATNNSGQFPQIVAPSFQTLTAYRTLYQNDNSSVTLFSVRSAIDNNTRSFQMFKMSLTNGTNRTFEADNYNINLPSGVVFFCFLRNYSSSKSPKVFEFTSGSENIPWQDEHLADTKVCNLDDLTGTTLRCENDQGRLQLSLFVLYSVAGFLCFSILITLIVFAICVCKRAQQQNALLLSQLAAVPKKAEDTVKTPNVS